MAAQRPPALCRLRARARGLCRARARRHRARNRRGDVRRRDPRGGPQRPPGLGVEGLGAPGARGFPHPPGLWPLPLAAGQRAGSEGRRQRAHEPAHHLRHHRRGQGQRRGDAAHSAFRGLAPACARGAGQRPHPGLRQRQLPRRRPRGLLARGGDRSGRPPRGLELPGRDGQRLLHRLHGQCPAPVERQHPHHRIGHGPALRGHACGEVVWEYILPWFAEYPDAAARRTGPGRLNSVFQTWRYHADQLPWLGAAGRLA